MTTTITTITITAIMITATSTGINIADRRAKIGFNEMIGNSTHRVKLMCWFSPAFPIGSFAFSHGLEWANEAGDLATLEALETYMRDLVLLGSGRNDIVLLALAWKAAAARNERDLRALNALALALQPTSERHLESVTQGNAFRNAILAAWPHPNLCYSALGSSDIALPVAAGVAAAAHGIGLEEVAEAYLTAFAANLVSACLRLSACGQTDAQRILAALAQPIAELSSGADEFTLESLGSPCFRHDLGSMRHEIQYSRLFRS